MQNQKNKNPQVKLTNPLEIRDCGLMPYRDALDLQYKLVEQKRNGRIPNTVLVVEHPAVITLGARQSANKLLADRDYLAKKEIDLVDIRRGGGTTAHNPGQLVFYPILNLRNPPLGINEYIRQLEAVGMELLQQLNVTSHRRSGFPGLWVGQRKIASIGVRVSKFITYHGMAININNDLSIFELFVPCGLEGVEMTSVLRETGKQHSMTRIKEKLAGALVSHFSSGESVEYE